MTFGYPVFLDLREVVVLVVGAGPIGARKVQGLAEAGARVRVVAERIDVSLDRASVHELHERRFEPDDLAGAQLVVTATGDTDTDAAVAAQARAAGIWVNAADQPADCTFILPAVARRGSVTVAVSTDGASPALAGHLRDRCAELLTPEVAVLADELRAERAAVRAAGGSTETVDWRPRIRTALAAAPPPEPSA